MQERARKSLTDQLLHNTARVECHDGAGGLSVGTAFFFRFLRKDQESVPALVTNKHVVDGSVSGAFHLTLRRPDGSPDVGNHRRIELPDFADRWLPHPDPEIDLCIMPIAPLLQAAKQNGFAFAYSVFEKDLIPNAEALDALAAVEDVLMIGYPIGIWDSANNLPIVRRGITATPPRIDYQGRTEFMIDMACFSGSSGSPVILLNEGSYLDHIRGGMVVGSRLLLLGILYAGPQFTAEGDIVTIDIPTRAERAARTPVPMNLGMVIRSDRLLDFEEPLRRKLGQSTVA